jgi:hypothetical protein
MGYYGVFLGLEYQNNISMIKKLDGEKYDASNTVTIQVPLAIPYALDQNEFERVDGLFEHHGEFYRLVKQRYANDTLTVVCVKDYKNQRIHQALSDFVKTFTAHPSSHQQHTKIVISIIKDYLPLRFSMEMISIGWQLAIASGNVCSHLVPSYTASIVHPPERVSMLLS